MSATFSREERLKSKKSIAELFEKGEVIEERPFRLLYLEKEVDSSFPVQVAISVPRRKVRKAVDRNRLKRLIREAYRKNKTDLYREIEQMNKQFVLFIIYNGSPGASYKSVEKKIIELILRFTNNVSKAHIDSKEKK